jgi:hypothetical protein
MAQHITADDIVNWSSRSESKDRLPVLIRRLIHSTAITGAIKSIDFPSDKSTSLPGYDGILEHHGNTPWIPDGTSVWELSTEKKVKKKANEDIDKRTQNSLEQFLAETTYIGVSTHKFPGKNNWKNEKRNCRWKEVRFYDADDLSQWLESSFSTSFWFAKMIGHSLAISGVSLLERYWEGVRKMAYDNIVVSPELFTNSRKENIEELVSFLRGQPTSLAIESDSDGSTLDFIAAVIESIDERDTILSKALILDNTVDWNSIQGINNHLIFIAKSSLSEKLKPEQLAMTNNQHLIRIAPAFKRSQQQRILRLSRFNKYELLPQLVKAGYTPAEANQLVNKVGGSGENLRNLISKFSEVCKPKERSDSIRPFVWIGGWARNSPGDKEIVKRLNKMNDYERTESLILNENKRADSLFYVDSEIINLYSKHHAWNLFADSVPNQEFEDFLSVAISVIGERNPKFDLPSDKQWKANLYGKIPKYSDTLKKNIAETMACLASLYDNETITFLDPVQDKVKVQHKFDETIAKILHPKMTMEDWASLNAVLVLLAEISPKSFIRAVRNELEKKGYSVFVSLMHDNENTTNECKHSGLLWALEVLSVSKDYHKDAVEILFSLMEIDIGGYWNNRPRTTLLEKIYCLWHLYSDVDLETRVAVLDNLLIERESAVWDILFNVVFRSPTIVSGHLSPNWRSWGVEINEQNISNDSDVFRRKCTERVINHLKTDYTRWQMMFKHLSRITSEQNFCKKFVERLEKLGENIPKDWTDIQRADLTNEIRKQLNLEELRDESKEVMPEYVKKCLDIFLKKIEPENIVLRHAWLFNYYADEFFFTKCGAINSELWQQTIDNAISQIIKLCGFEGIRRLVNIAKEPDWICKPLVKQFSDQFFNQVIPAYFESDSKNEQIFASSFLSILCQGKKDVWEKKYQSDTLNPRQWEKEMAICFLSAFSDGKELWYWVNEFDESVQKDFWAKQSGNYWSYDKWDNEIILFVYKHLTDCQNYDAALTFATPQKNKKYDVGIIPHLSLLQDVSKHIDTVSNFRAVVDIIVFLQKQFIENILTDEEQLQLAEIELFFINLLYDHFSRYKDCSPKVLVSQVMKSPEFFVKLLQYTFQPSKEEKPNYVEDDLPNASQIASATYKLLDNLNQIPGETNGIIDSNYLTKWVKKSRELAKNCARIGVCDSQIGHLFARCSSQTLEGQMPKVELMQIMEDMKSETILEGFYIGLINNRGITMRGSLEGGKQELDIATIYKQLAEQTSNYTNVSSIFDKLGAYYIEEAKEWDEKQHRRMYIDIL